MNQPRYDYDKYSDIFKKIQEPMQDLVDLNMETLKSFQSYNPAEFGKFTRPDELWHKQIEMAVVNGQKTIDYMQKSLKILEKTMLSFSSELKETVKK